MHPHVLRTLSLLGEWGELVDGVGAVGKRETPRAIEDTLREGAVTISLQPEIGVASDKEGDKGLRIRERIRGSFDRAAIEYSRLEARRAFFGNLAQRLLDLAPSLRGKLILDVGCGSGASLGVLRLAVGAAGTVVGLDVSSGMLREAKRQMGDEALVVLADGCGFGRTFQSVFDAVVYNAVLFILPDAAASLESAAAVLVPGGSVLISSLEGLYVGPDRRPVTEFLAERGHVPGRHALSPWPLVVPPLERFFVLQSFEKQVTSLTVTEFLDFYGLEPMSAGLLPSVPYPKRKAVFQELARDWERQRLEIVQVWTLAVALKPNRPGL